MATKKKKNNLLWLLVRRPIHSAPAAPAKFYWLFDCHSNGVSIVCGFPHASTTRLSMASCDENFAADMHGHWTVDLL